MNDGKNRSRDMGHSNIPCAAVVENRVKPLDEPPLQVTYLGGIQQNHPVMDPRQKPTERLKSNYIKQIWWKVVD